MIADLTKELEGQFAMLQDLQVKNRQLEESLVAGSRAGARWGAQKPPNIESQGSKSWDMILKSEGIPTPPVAPRGRKNSVTSVGVPSAPLPAPASAAWVRAISEEEPPALIPETRPESAKVSMTAKKTKTVIIAADVAPHPPPGGQMRLKSRMSTKTSRGSKVIDEGIQFSILRAGKTGLVTVQKPWFVINPDRSRFYSMWQIIISVALLFVALVTPVQVSLLEAKVDAVFFVGFLVDLIFCADLLMQFLTAYPINTAHGVLWEVRPRRICRNYLKGWFLVDAVTVVPFDFLAIFLGKDTLKDFVGLKVIRALRLVKLMRLMRGSKLLQDLEAPMSIPYQKVALLRFMCILILTCHWLACCWAVTLSIVDESFPRWIDDIVEADRPYGVVTTESPFRVYVASFYFMAYTVTSVGYGDISPRNLFERVVCSVLVLAAGLSWAYVIGEVGAITSDMTSESQEFRKTMHHLNLMMSDQQLPFDLQTRVRRYFLQNKYQSMFLARKSLMKRMSPQLQSEVSLMTNMRWLEQVTFFKQFMSFIRQQHRMGCYTGPYEACVADITRSLQLTAFAQQETFTNVQVLYILSKGLVALGSRVASLGALWGEDFVLADTALIRPVSGYALTYLELLSLTRDDFMQVIQRRRFTCPEIFRLVRRYCVRIGVYRGILAEARRRQLEIMAQEAEISRAKMEEANRELRSQASRADSWETMSIPGAVESKMMTTMA